MLCGSSQHIKFCSLFLFFPPSNSEANARRLFMISLCDFRKKTPVFSFRFAMKWVNIFTGMSMLSFKREENAGNVQRWRRQRRAVDIIKPACSRINQPLSSRRRLRDGNIVFAPVKEKSRTCRTFFRPLSLIIKVRRQNEINSKEVAGCIVYGECESFRRFSLCSTPSASSPHRCSFTCSRGLACFLSPLHHMLLTWLPQPLIRLVKRIHLKEKKKKKKSSAAGPRGRWGEG